MSTAANGKPFEVQLKAAGIKLARAAKAEDQVDRVSGFTEADIYHFIVDLPQPDNEAQQAKASALLRRNGYVI